MARDEDLVRRLHEVASSDASLQALTPDDLTLITITAMHDATLRPTLLKVMLQCIIDMAVDDALSQRAFALLFQSACSNSGTDVKVSHAKAVSPAPTTGVLVLGFAGANMGMIDLVGRSYQKAHPAWRVVTTTRSGVSDPRALSVREQHLREIESCLAGCDRLVVHAMSNNGQALWSELVARAPTLCARVRAIVFDCVGPSHAATFPIDAAHQVVKQTILSAAFVNQLDWRPPEHRPGERDLGSLVDAPVAAAVADTSESGLIDRTFRSSIVRQMLDVGQDEVTWVASAEPSVPTLLLTASDDVVVPYESTLAFRDALIAARPQRPVNLVRVAGQHVRLLQSSMIDTVRHINEHMRSAGLSDDGPDPPATVDVTDAPTNVPARAAAPTVAPPPLGECKELDNKMGVLARRLERLATGKGVKLGAKELTNLHVLLVRCIGLGAAVQGSYLRVLLALILDSGVVRAESHALVDVVGVATALCLSTSATRVHMMPPAVESGNGESVAVLLLGFGGASLESLAPIRAVYAAKWPSWRLVSAVRPGLALLGPPEAAHELNDIQKQSESLLTAQHDAILSHAADCARLVVHVLSNNGFYLWQDLLARRADELTPRLAALVFDCGPATDDMLGAAQIESIIGKTIVAASEQLRVPIVQHTARDGQAAPVAAPAIGELRKTLSSVASSVTLAPPFAPAASQGVLAAEPPVPTLFLTSATDDVLPEAGVRKYADDVRAASPGRLVSVATLAGAHCNLAKDDGSAYIARLEALVTEAGL